jgi:iron complex outermembrane recepter protein
MVIQRRRTIATAITLLLIGANANAQTQTEDKPVSNQTTVLNKIDVSATAIRAGEINLDAIAGTASRLGLSIRETPAAVYLVDRETIEARGDRTTQDALRNVPGMTAAAPPGSAGFVSYRGFNGSQLTQLFNGISVQYDVIAAKPVDSWIYDRVEVIGGPSSFLFGAGAVGGSINYVTKLAERIDKADALIRLGTYDTAQLAAGFNRQLSGDTKSGNYLRIDANVSQNGDKLEGNTSNSQQVVASLLSDLSSRITHTLALEYQHERQDRPYWGTPLLNPTIGTGRILDGTRFKNYNSADGLYEQTVYWARSMVDIRIANNIRLKNTAYLYDALRDYQNVEEYTFDATNTNITRFSPLLQRHDQKLVGNRIEGVFSTTLNSLKSDTSFGLDYSINKQTRFPNGPAINISTVNPFNFQVENFFSIPGITRTFNPDRQVRVKTTAFFVENRTQLSSTLALLSGLRHDKIDLDLTNRRAITAANPATLNQQYQPTTGRVGLMWDVMPTANIYAQYATAADPPAGILTTASFAQARTNTELTTGKQFEVGSKLQLMDGRAVITLAAFKIERKNLATPNPAVPTTTLLVGQQSSRGFEIALDARLTSTLTAQANLALVKPEFDNFSIVTAGRAVSLAGNAPANTPKRVGNLWLTYSFMPDWEATIALRGVSSVFGNTANTLSASGYGLVDLGLKYKLTKKITLSARVRNAGDKIYAANVTTTPLFLLGESRAADLTMKVNF